MVNETVLYKYYLHPVGGQHVRLQSGSTQRPLSQELQRARAGEQ